MRARDLPKALERIRTLPLSRVLDTAGRRAWAAMRGRASDLAAERLGLRDDGAIALSRAVPNAASVAEAVQRLEGFAGQPPVPGPELSAWLPEWRARFPEAADALVARAESTIAGRFRLVGFPETELGVRPDWQADFVRGVRWDGARASRELPIVRGDGSDIKVPWELSRLQHLPALAHALLLTRDSRCLEALCAQLEDWIAANPPGLGVNWTCAMEVALRAVSMSWAFELARRDPRFPDALRARVYWSLFAHGQFLRGHLEDGGVSIGNHYVADLLGLLWLGTLYPAFRDADRWRVEAETRLSIQLESQILPDGGDAEASLAYHRLVAELVGLSLAILSANGRAADGIAVSLREVFARMARFTSAVLKPDGTAPQLGDNDGGRALQLVERAPLDHRYLLSWAALAASDAALARKAPLDPEAALVIGPAAFAHHAELEALGGPASGERLDLDAVQLPDSGLTVVRRDGFYAMLSATPVGQEGAGGHGHNDKLSIELWLSGDAVADPGSFGYTGDPVTRNAFRSTAAHATLDIDGREQNPVTADLFLLPERAHAAQLRFSELFDGRLVWEGEHRGFAPFVHRRVVEIDPAARALDVVDEVTGPGRDEHAFTVRFPLALGLRASIEDRRARVAGDDRESFWFELIGPDALAFDIEGGWYSPNYGSRARRQVLCARVRHRVPAILRIRVGW